MKEFYSVKEFAVLAGVEASTLRFWDDIGLFSPIKRDPVNNYRYYVPDQIIALNFFKVLSNLNVSLKTISEIESDLSPEKMEELIEKQERLLDMEMQRLRENYSIIHTRREHIKLGLKVDETKISVEHQNEDRFFIPGPRNDFGEEGGFHESFVNFCNHAEELRINLNYPIGGMHNNWERFMNAPGQPDHFFSLDPTGNRKRAAGDYLTGFNRGYYGQFGDLPKRMEEYAKENFITVSGPLYAVYLHDEICMKDPSQYLVQVMIAASKQ